MELSIFWFRRDLRLIDNKGLNKALASGKPVLPIFIFDTNILKELPRNDARLNFIHKTLKDINETLQAQGKSLLCLHGDPLTVWQDLIKQYTITEVFYNKDYEPYALDRDAQVRALLEKQKIAVHPTKDQVIFEPHEVLKKDGKPYTIYTPYKNKWLEYFDIERVKPSQAVDFEQFYTKTIAFPSLETIGFESSTIKVHPYTLDQVAAYEEVRDFPAKDATSYLSPHLRFGTISVRQIIWETKGKSAVFLSELVWREFFMQILFHFPRVVNNNFKPQYDTIPWRNNQQEFELWCKGETGYPMVDAGMRQLNQTGYMHNRTRMVVASFLCKHLLIDWRWGEAYFAEKLLDYDLSANNGNWQWAAGTGCDASPYFRVFNPTSQMKKFDKTLAYIKKWVPEYETFGYVAPMVEHKFARQRAIDTYKGGIKK